MMKWVVAMVIILGSSLTAHSQDYKTAIGLRLGGTSGVTIKHFYARTTAVEGIVGFFGNGMSVTGLIEKHTPAFDTRGMHLYYGGGAHVAFYNGRNYNNRFWRDTNYNYSSEMALGINGVLGLEYTIPNTPLAFSLDLKPFLEFGSSGYFGFSPDPSLGVKFIIR